MLCRFRAPISLCVAALFTSFAHAQQTYSWNYSGTDWNNAASWSPGGGPPTSADTALFDHYPGTTFANQPSFSASTAVGRLLFLGPRPLAAFNWTGNGNTLTLGTGSAMSESPLTVRGGFGINHTISNLNLIVAPNTTLTGTAATLGAFELSGFGTVFRLQNNSSFRLISLGTTTQNYDLTITNAQLALTPGASVSNGVGQNTFQQGRLTFQGGGILNVSGATTGSAVAYTMNQVAPQSGHTQINLTPSTSGVSLTLGNGTLQAGLGPFVQNFDGTFVSALSDGTIQINTGAAIPFTASASNPSRLLLAPGASGITTTNGVITRNAFSANTNIPYVIITGTVTGVTGTATRFATIESGTGTREVLGQAGTQRTETDLGSAVSTENTIYRPSNTTANATLNNSITMQTLVLEPRGGNQSINLNGNTITANSIAVSGGTSTSVFTLTGGSLAGQAAADRIFFVTNSGVTLASDSNFAGSNNSSIIKAGLGILSLTGTSDQMSFPAITDIVINSGILRARIDGPGLNFGTTGNSLNFRGGVLEIDAQGGTSNFTRSLGTGFGQVNWTGGIPFEVRQERGSGGFAALNGTVNINVGGAGATLVWNGTGTNRFFLRSGNALTLGSTTQTGILNFQNGIGLDDGSATAPRDTRYINIATSPATVSDPTRRVRVTGVISGSANTSLAYGGTGLVEVTGANTYSGGTIIDQAYVQINNATGSGTGTGPVLVTRGILLGNGTIAPSAGNGLTVTGPSGIGGILIPDSSFGTPGHLKIGTAGVNNPLTLNPGASFGVRINGSTFDTNGGPTSYGRVTVRGTGAITITDAILSTGFSNSFTPTAGDAFGILDNQTANALVGTLIYSDFDGSTTTQSPLPQDGTFPIRNASNTLIGFMKMSYTGNIVGATVSPTGGNDLVVYGFTPVPEPGLMLAASVTLGLVGVHLRKRRR